MIIFSVVPLGMLITYNGQYCYFIPLVILPVLASQLVKLHGIVSSADALTTVNHLVPTNTHRSAAIHCQRVSVAQWYWDRLTNNQESMSMSPSWVKKIFWSLHSQQQAGKLVVDVWCISCDVSVQQWTV